MDQGIIAATKLNYRKELLDVKVSIHHACSGETSRPGQGAHKMVAGTMGLAEGHHPHMLDAADLLKLAWDKMTWKTIARCMYLIRFTQCTNIFGIPTARCCAWGNIAHLFCASL